MVARWAADKNPPIGSQRSCVSRFVTRYASFSLEGDESRKDFLAIMGKHGLGMELHSVHGEFAMAERHDFSVAAFCSDFETAGQRSALHNKRMISTSLERRGQIGKEAIPVMRNGRCLAVHQPRSAN